MEGRVGVWWELGDVRWMGWDGIEGMGWDGMGWEGMGWEGMGWDVIWMG